MIYLRIKAKGNINRGKTKSIFEKLLLFFLPKANLDFEERLGLVTEWILEFENENSTPNREIGLNFKNEVIVKMPYKSNYGFWTDNNLVYQDYTNKFDYTNITKDVFKDYWEKLK